MAEPHVLETREALERAIRVERSALAQDLVGLSEAQWAKASLCERWTVEEVVAHLTAGASTRMWRWLLSMVAARFDSGLHNGRRLAQHRGATPEETLRRFREVVDGPAGPSGHTAAWLGETVVHSEDIRRPLGLVRTPPRGHDDGRGPVLRRPRFHRREQHSDRGPAGRGHGWAVQHRLGGSAPAGADPLAGDGDGRPCGGL
ncbi:maleylpyruvate isomerase family mycothiol-dependent enzyme [Streptomyces sp. NPDC029041]|uniref:maleylpyruvate isomerase family mycothiol-dependent enzyme n=1 Tax=Streptomyces sp. NPDC029041 TaxID=3155727 RepID=UPI0033FB95A2